MSSGGLVVRSEESRKEGAAGSVGPGRLSQNPRSHWGCEWGRGGSQGPALTCVTSSLGVTHVSPPAVKLQKTRKASRAQPWLGSTQYSPVG